MFGWAVLMSNMIPSHGIGEAGLQDWALGPAVSQNRATQRLTVQLRAKQSSITSLLAIGMAEHRLRA